ncbi:MAG: hypothetical protein K9H26_13590 [Prolixibacteraceae bacterium]|nr:hypothetical protein [Prolixibacteraceae bacterium]
MNKNIYILLSLLVLTACNIKIKRSDSLKSSNKIYKQKIEAYENKFVDHFPVRLNTEDYTIIERSAKNFGETSLFLNLYNISEIDSLILSFKAKNVIVYNAAQKPLLVVNQFTNEDNVLSILSQRKTDEMKYILDSINYHGLLPVPNFFYSRNSDKTTQCKLPKDFNLYVLEAQSGKFWDNDHLSNGKYMPNEWKNGYSKGVAISKKRNTVIYWFIIW